MKYTVSVLVASVLITGCRRDPDGRRFVESGSTAGAGSGVGVGGSVEAGSAVIRPGSRPIPDSRVVLPELPRRTSGLNWRPQEGLFHPRVLQRLALREELENARGQLDLLKHQPAPPSEEHRRAARALENQVELTRGVTEYGVSYTAAAIDAIGEAFEKLIPHLKQLDNLRRVVFRAHNTSKEDEPLGEELAALEALSDLRSLKFEYTKISSQGFEELGRLDQLQKIAFERCRIDDKELRVVASLSQLRAVHLRNLYGDGVTDAGMRHLAELRHLESVVLSGLNITDTGIEFLADCEHLRRLTISSPSVTGEAVAEVITVSRGDSELEVLELHLKKITWLLPNRLGELPLLKRLLIGRNQLTNRAIRGFDFASSPYLEELEIGESEAEEPLTGDCLRYLARNRALRVLRIETDNLASDDLRHITRLRNLRLLNLGGLVLNEASVMYLSQLPRLETLGIGAFELSPLARRRLHYLSSLQTVWFGASANVTNRELLALQALPNLEYAAFWGDGNTPSQQVRDRLSHVRLRVYE